MFTKIIERRKHAKLEQLEREKIAAVSTGQTDSSIPDFSKIVFNAAISFSEKYKGYHEGHAIGWLGKFVTNEGELPNGFLDILEAYRESNVVDSGDLGFHTCEICNEHTGRGEFVIDTGEHIYHLPSMITHYIKVHGYCPPTKFITDVTRYARRSESV